MMSFAFGERLRELRKGQHISQRALAEVVQVDYTYISKIETGDNPPPSTATIHRIAQALDADENELIVLAEKIPVKAYKALLQRAYKLLYDINQPFTNVERCDVQQWLEDAKYAGIEVQ